VLQLGNLCFEADADQHHADGARLSGGSDGERCLHGAANLLGLKPHALLNLLTTKTIETGQAPTGGSSQPKRSNRRGTTLAVQLNPAAATLARDAMARLVYGHLFGWVVATVNDSLAPFPPPRAPEAPGGTDEYVFSGDGVSDGARVGDVDPHAGAERRSLGLLDMFGFEAFLQNDLEQLLINLANEALQDMYCQQVGSAHGAREEEKASSHHTARARWMGCGGGSWSSF
jgi:myosin heavy subunit